MPRKKTEVEAGPCPKCGGVTIGLHYLSYSERLRCTCWRCHYEWFIATLDKSAGTKQEEATDAA